MKKHLLIIREVDRSIFDAVESGRKIVETRAATPKYRKIKKGDVLEFKCGADVILKKAKKIIVFNHISDLLERYRACEINPDLSTEEEIEKMYYSFPDYKEKIDKFGIIAIELE
ncbi:MAG: hypothetical protein U9M89_01885 [Patescibacteria group bacterium]|nr:hypothetical protein [Patescibacteria group bacterium]